MALVREDYEKLAEENNLEFIAEKTPPTVRDYTHWRCLSCYERYGEQVETDFWLPYARIAYEGRGCPNCTRQNFVPPSAYRALAEQMGYVFVGKVPPAVTTKTEWKMPSGITHASYHDVRQRLRAKQERARLNTTRNRYKLHPRQRYAVLVRAHPKSKGAKKHSHS